MPFTLAHPAAVLPLVRRPFNGLALVCGAMAPDVAYFIRSTPLEVTAQSWYEPFTNATTTHSLAGLVPTTLLLASGLYVVLRIAVRPALWLAHGRWSAPDGFGAEATPDPAGGAVSRTTVTRGTVTRSALNRDPVGRGPVDRGPVDRGPVDRGPVDRAAVSRGAGRSVWVPVSLLIGALTHLVWDSLASSNGWLAARFDGLNETAVGDMTWIHLVQHGSTAIGLTVLAVVLWRHRRSLVGDDAATRRRAFRVVAGFATVGLAAAAGSVLSRFDPSASPSRRDQVENAIAIAITGAGVAVAMTLLVATALWWLALLRIHRTAASISVE